MCCRHGNVLVSYFSRFRMHANQLSNRPSAVEITISILDKTPVPRKCGEAYSDRSEKPARIWRGYLYVDHE